MTVVDAKLLVALKGADLTAQTAFLAMVTKMGLERRVAGVKRFDYFALSIETEVTADHALAALKRTLDSQSTFYNRNKHLYELTCQIGGQPVQVEGVSGAVLRERWSRELANYLHPRGDGNLDGKEPSGPVILNDPCVYLVEALVEDDDPSPRQTVAGKVARDLERFSGAPARVVCHHRATLWWLAVAARDVSDARKVAEGIVVTKRRDVGLLLNPNYQHAEFVSIEEIAPVSS